MNVLEAESGCLHSLPEDKATMSGWKTSVPMHEITQSHDLEE